MGNYGNYGNSSGAAVVKAVRGLGHTLQLEGDGTIRIHPPLQDVRHLQRLRENKPEVAAHLRGEAVAERETLGKAEHLGMIAKWSRGHVGYIAILDPTTGEYHDLPVKDAPEWARREARERRDMWKYERVKGDPTAREMERRFQANRTPVDEGITEDLEAVI